MELPTDWPGEGEARGEGEGGGEGSEEKARHGKVPG